MSIIQDYEKQDCFEFIDLMRRPWRNRIWVRQEVGLASNIVVPCGVNQIGWSTLCQAACKMKPNFLEVISPTEPHPEVITVWSMISDGSPIRPLETVRMQQARGESIKLLELLRLNSEAEATMKKDMIYALLGLVTDTTVFEAIPPDYSNNVHLGIVYYQVMRYLDDHEPSVDLLRFCGCWETLEDLPNGRPLPTWMIDWEQYDARSHSGKRRRFVLHLPLHPVLLLFLGENIRHPELRPYSA